MIDTIIVGVILALAAGYVIYRIFLRPSCGCATCDSCGGASTGAKKLNEIKSGSCGCGGAGHDAVKGESTSGSCCGGGSACNCGK